MSDFEKLTPASLGPWTGETHTGEHNGRPFWRISVWKGGVEQRRKDFLYEPLATGWAEKHRVELKADKEFAFVRKTAHNQPQETQHDLSP